MKVLPLVLLLLYKTLDVLRVSAFLSAIWKCLLFGSCIKITHTTLKNDRHRPYECQDFLVVVSETSSIMLLRLLQVTAPA